MFGVDFCDVKMKSTYCLKFSTNVFMVESEVSFRHQILIMMSSSNLSSFKANFRSAKTNFVFHRLELRVSWTVVIKTTISMQLQQRLPDSIEEKISKRRRVFPARGQSWTRRETIFKKITGSNTSCKLLFLLIFFAKQRSLKRLGKTVVQLQGYCFTDLLISRVYSLIDRWCLSIVTLHGISGNEVNARTWYTSTLKQKNELLTH